MKTCAKCGNENPSSAIHCMKCGCLLVKEADLSEEQKLQKKLEEAEKENELLKSALETLQEKLQESGKENEPLKSAPETQSKGTTPPDTSEDNNPEKEETFSDNSSSKDIKDDLGFSCDDSPSNKKLLLLAIALIVIAGVVGGGIYWYNVYIPAKRDAEAPRYYVISSSLKVRSNTFFDGDANIVGTVSYGTELIVYDSVPGEYFLCKFAPLDAKGKVIKEQVLEGYVHYDYVLPKNDFFLLNSIFGNDDAKEMLSETRYKKALLEVFKKNNYIGGLTEEQAGRYGFSYDLLQNKNGRFQVFCRNKKAKNNNVYYSRQYRKYSKYTDVAIQLNNLDVSNERLLLYFAFDDDETPRLLVKRRMYNKGYMKDGTLKLYETHGDYWLTVDFTE